MSEDKKEKKITPNTGIIYNDFYCSGRSYRLGHLQKARRNGGTVRISRITAHCMGYCRYSYIFRRSYQCRNCRYDYRNRGASIFIFEKCTATFLHIFTDGQCFAVVQTGSIASIAYVFCRIFTVFFLPFPDFQKLQSSILKTKGILATSVVSGMGRWQVNTFVI